MNKDVAYWLLMHAQQIEDQNGPQHLSVGMREGADEIKRLAEENAKLRAALACYACEGDCANCRGDFPDFVCGQRARAALGGEND